ncbi:MAG: hypothetical protein V1835_01725 [Candidatus Micrarchaeota archaeon]
MNIIHFDARKKPEYPHELLLWNKYIDARSKAFFGPNSNRRYENRFDLETNHIIAVQGDGILGGLRMEDASSALRERGIGLEKLPANTDSYLWLNHLFVDPGLEGTMRKNVLAGILKEASGWAIKNRKNGFIFGVNEEEKPLQKLYKILGAEDTGLVVIALLTNKPARIFTADAKILKKLSEYK